MENGLRRNQEKPLKLTVSLDTPLPSETVAKTRSQIRPPENSLAPARNARKKMPTMPSTLLQKPSNRSARPPLESGHACSESGTS